MVGRSPSSALHFLGGKDEPAASDRLPRLQGDLYRIACEGEVNALRGKPHVGRLLVMQQRGAPSGVKLLQNAIDLGLLAR
jgi:hypothetical protein